MYRRVAASFISEHSVEFCVVPKICEILQAKWSVTPVCFWSTREGSRLAKESCAHSQIKVMALFARRPKVTEVGSRSIIMKVNASVQQWALSLCDSAIPTICGIPLVSAILDFHTSSECAWFMLSPSTMECEDISVKVDLNKNLAKTADPFLHKSLQSLCPEEILSLSEEAQWTPPSEALETIGTIGRKHQEALTQRFFLFGATYKPVYLLLSEKEKETWQ